VARKAVFIRLAGVSGKVVATCWLVWKRLGRRPVGERGGVEAVLAEVENEIGEAVAAEPEGVALDVLGGRAPAGAAEALDHAAAVAELARRGGGLARIEIEGGVALEGVDAGDAEVAEDPVE
jgi:hypothetical protein